MTISLQHDSAQLAETYDRLSDSQFEGGVRLIERLELKGPTRLLDLGCGTGRLALWAAAHLPAGSEVVALDPLPERIAVARRVREARADLRHPVHFGLGTAEDLQGLAAGSFDAVVLSSVFHWIKDKPRALAEVARVLRPKARLGITTNVKDVQSQNPANVVAQRIFSAGPYAGRVELGDEAPGRPAFLSASELIAALEDAGFRLLDLHIFAREQVHASGDAFVEWIQSSSFGNHLRNVPEDLRDQARRDLATALEDSRRGDGIPLWQHRTLVVAERA
jgi:ubiquinone/menaquinone biosynthesis C-methylase UbiE